MPRFDDPRQATPEPGASWFVMLVWLAMTAAAVVFVLRFGPEVPIGDDHALMPVLTGDRPLTAGWLWSQHNEHRVPLSRLVLLGAYPLAGYDFRAGMFVTVGCLSLLALLLTMASARVRGWSSLVDAFFPIALLNWGHHSNLLWSWQVSFGLSVLLAGGLASVIAIRRDRLDSPTLWGIGLLLTLMPLCAANGLAMVPPVSAWLIGLGVTRLRSGTPGGWAAIGASGPALALLALYFVGYERPAEIDRATGPIAVLRTGLQFLSLGFGPISGKRWEIGGAVVLGLASSAAVVLLARARRRAADRIGTLGLLSVLVGLGLLTLGLAWGRAGGNDQAGLEPRYVTPASLVPCVAALCWVVAGPSALQRIILLSLFSAGGCLLLWPNSEIGLREASERRLVSDAIVADLKSGAPPLVLSARYDRFLHPSHDILAETMPRLGRAKLGLFEQMRPDPPLRESPLTSTPAHLSLARWNPSTRTIEATGIDPWATFTLPDRTWVAGIRIRYALDNNSETYARFRMQWRRSDQAGYPPEQSYERWALPTGPNRSMVVWIAAPMDSFRIQPDNRPCTFRIEEMTLLSPEGHVAP